MPQVPNGISAKTLARLTKAAQASKDEEELKITNDPEEDVPMVGEPDPGEEDLSVTHDENAKKEEPKEAPATEPEPAPEPEPKTEEPVADKGSDPEDSPAPGDAEKEDELGGDTPVGEVTDFLAPDLKGMLDQQIGNELFAFYEYKAAASWFQRNGLLGFACWANGQAADEICHMEKVLSFLNELDLSPVMPELENPSTEYESVQDAVEIMLEREKAVTANWRSIGAKSMEYQDSATLQLAQCFVTEQMEEEDSAKTILDMLKHGPVLLVDQMLRS